MTSSIVEAIEVGPISISTLVYKGLSDSSVAVGCGGAINIPGNRTRECGDHLGATGF